MLPVCHHTPGAGESEDVATTESTLTFAKHALRSAAPRVKQNEATVRALALSTVSNQHVHARGNLNYQASFYTEHVQSMQLHTSSARRARRQLGARR